MSRYFSTPHVLTMKIPQILLLFQLIIINTVLSDLQEIPQKVEFYVLTEKYEEIKVNLVPTETFLANENVPVWISQEENPGELTLRKNVMQEVGPFTVYRDPHSCTAAIYFHKNSQFEGTIGHHHVIHKLKYNSKLKNVVPSFRTVYPSPLIKHQENRFSTVKHLIMKEAGDKVTNWMKSLRKYPDTVYIEILVMVNYDITEDLMHDYDSVVTYVVTLFNTVDMLYSKIEVPKIKLNIAGIIIGNSKLSFPEFIKRSCYIENNNNDGNSQLDAVCILGALKSTLQSYEAIPTQSYDIMIFLAKSHISRYKFNAPTRNLDCATKTLCGLAISPIANDTFRKLEDKGMAIVSDRQYLKFFPTVAHEIAHLLGVPHDGGLLWKEDGTCDAHLMKKDGSFCKRCLTFGGKTPEYLQMFFGSTHGCLFQNKPRSLHDPSDIQLFWNVDEQCQCYGYRSAHKSTGCFAIRQLFSPTIDCKSRLKCKDENGRVHDTNVYMNGTPCDKDEIGEKVCWDEQCVFSQTERYNKINEIF